jgi:hypothetical protein
MLNYETAGKSLAERPRGHRPTPVRRHQPLRTYRRRLDPPEMGTAIQSTTTRDAGQRGLQRSEDMALVGHALVASVTVRVASGSGGAGQPTDLVVSPRRVPVRRATAARTASASPRPHRRQPRRVRGITDDHRRQAEIDDDSRRGSLDLPARGEGRDGNECRRSSRGRVSQGTAPRVDRGAGAMDPLFPTAPGTEVSSAGRDRRSARLAIDPTRG